MDSQVLVFFVNGKKVEVHYPNPEETLLQHLRRTLLLTGTKEACGQGACGACTVMLSQVESSGKIITLRNIGRPVVEKHIKENYSVKANACLIPICYLHGMAVTTVEGVGSTRNGLHPIQKQLVESHGLQCGFCTPGMVMTMYTLIRNNPKPSYEMIERVLEGNLCRCTGYRPIVEAFKKCPCGLGLCNGNDISDTRIDQNEVKGSRDQQRGIEPTQDPIFPSELQLNSKYRNSTVIFNGGNFSWIRPATLTELLDYKHQHPDAAVVMGCTSIGYLLRKGKMFTNTIICATHVKELNNITTSDTGILVGAGVTMRMLEETVCRFLPSVTDEKKRTLVAIKECLRWLAADQVRNIATIGGHIMSHAPNLDLQVLLMAANAELTFASKEDGQCKCQYGSDFINNGLKAPIKNGILQSVFIPFTKQTEYISIMKQPHRRGYDYAVVNAGLFVRLNQSVIDELRLCFGGVDSKPKVALQTSKYAAGRQWNEETVDDINKKIVEELGNTDMNELKYRLSLACGFFFKFFKQQKEGTQTKQTYGTSSGSQVFSVPDTDDHVSVWKPSPHYSGDSLVSGEAEFIDDIPKYQNEVFVAFVTSTKAHAKLLSVDTSAAMSLPGVVEYIDGKDVPGSKNYGLVSKDNVLFAEDKVTYHGQVIGAVAAETREIARKATQLVKITYEELNAVFTNKEAIAKKSFYDFSSEIKKGDVEKAIAESEVVIDGEVEIGTQEHMYMETQSVLVVPKRERQEMEIFVSTQGCKLVQTAVCNFLGVPSNRIVVKCKRLGGGFGGKTSDCLPNAGIAAVTALKTGRPVRSCLDRETDFRVTGKRHPVLAFYKAGCSENGKIKSVDIKFYVNAGHTMDPSHFLIMKGLPQISGCYNFENFRAKGLLCYTNIPSNTPIRGFGGPQMAFIIENIINDIAIKLQMDKAKVCEINMYKEGDETPSKMVLENFNVPRCLKECLQDSNYTERKRDVQAFNSSNRWKKRGISVIPMMYPIGYPPCVLNQSTALVHAYVDGSVLLAHGGMEMGQGIHTKMLQIAATELGIPMNKIFISETSTNTVANASDTSASTGTDLCAGAVKNTCEILSKRLEPYRKMNPQGTWEDWVQAAYQDRVSLSVSGFYKMKEKDYDFTTHTGPPCLYYTFGAGVSEVEIDCLTGEHQLLRTDIVMDLGKSLNPAVDIGQIEGAFMMGYGLLTTEQISVDKNGRMANSGPINYKIPTVRNIPREFKVKILKDTENNLSVYSAKGIGEPALLLAISVHHAIKEAILAARKESGLTGNYHLESPATVDRIRLACQDSITSKCEKAAGKDLENRIPI